METMVCKTQLSTDTNLQSAYDLTTDKKFEGNEVEELKKIIESCKRCDLSICYLLASNWGDQIKLVEL